jgi:GT2 family glycosyltransferase
MKTSIMITTRNRREELRRTLGKLFELQPAADEILICADGCTDGTSEIVRQDFPSCILLENDSARGSVFSRDRLLRTASGDIVLSLDDDSYPLDRDFFARLQLVFGQHAGAAVITFPELRDGGASADPAKLPSSPAHLVSAYPNCAAAMRREIYLRLGGYPIFFEHAYEEPDYALQCYAAGYTICFDPRLSIRHHHLSSQNGSRLRRHPLNARNELWSVLMRCPFPYVIAVALFRMWRQFRHACSKGPTWAIREPVWWWSAFRGIPTCLRHRSPIEWRVYYAWMKLARQPVSSASQLFDKTRTAAA